MDNVLHMADANKHCWNELHGLRELLTELHDDLLAANIQLSSHNSYAAHESVKKALEKIQTSKERHEQK